MNPLIIKVLLSAASSEDGRKIIIGIAGAVLALLFLFTVSVGGILTAVIHIVNPSIAGKESESIHYQAIKQVKASKNIENDFDVSWLIMIDMLLNHGVMKSMSDVSDFLTVNFVTKHEKTVTIQPDEENIEPYTETVTYYLFSDGAALMQKIMSPPFNFTEDNVDVIRNMIYADIFMSGGELVFNGKYPMPMQGSITSAYGYRLDPFTGLRGEFHDGLDICGNWHDNVMSIADGTVYSSNISSVYGNNIIIEHNIDDQRFFSFYAHLSKRLVSAGQMIQQGQIIGIEGGDASDPNPGRSTGHHLHFGILVNPSYRSHIDPTGFLYG